MDHHRIIAVEANPHPQWDGEAAVVFATTVAEDRMATDEEEAEAHTTVEIVGEVVVSSILTDGDSGEVTPFLLAAL